MRQCRGDPGLNVAFRAQSAALSQELQGDPTRPSAAGTHQVSRKMPHRRAPDLDLPDVPQLGLLNNLQGIFRKGLDHGNRRAVAQGPFGSL